PAQTPPANPTRPPRWRPAPLSGFVAYILPRTRTTRTSPVAGPTRTDGAQMRMVTTTPGSFTTYCGSGRATRRCSCARPVGISVEGAAYVCEASRVPDQSTPFVDEPASDPALLRTLTAAGLPATGRFVSKAGWVSRAWIGDDYVVRLNTDGRFRDA